MDSQEPTGLRNDSETILPTPDEVLFYTTHLSYTDHIPNFQPSPEIIQKNEQWMRDNPNSILYTRELKSMFEQYGQQTVEDAAQKAIDQLLKDLDHAGVEPSYRSGFENSKSWFLWHAAKLRFLAAHPEVRNDASKIKNADKYNPVDPFSSKSHAAFDEIVATHLGWEYYQAVNGHGLPVSTERFNQQNKTEIETLLNKPPKNNNTLSSFELRRLGDLISSSSQDTEGDDNIQEKIATIFNHRHAHFVQLDGLSRAHANSPLSRSAHVAPDAQAPFFSPHPKNRFEHLPSLVHQGLTEIPYKSNIKTDTNSLHVFQILDDDQQMNGDSVVYIDYRSQRPQNQGSFATFIGIQLSPTEATELIKLLTEPSSVNIALQELQKAIDPAFNEVSHIPRTKGESKFSKIVFTQLGSKRLANGSYYQYEPRIIDTSTKANLTLS